MADPIERPLDDPSAAAPARREPDKDAVFCSEEAIEADRANVAKSDRDHERIFGMENDARRADLRAEIGEGVHTRSRNSPLGR